MPDKKGQFGPEMGETPIGQYYLLDKIAQGGMAEIYKGLAYDLHGIKRTVVIKKILPNIAADPEFINMLINEAKIAVMLSHGNIAQIYDLGKVGNDYFMVMEFVDGKSLSQINKKSTRNRELVPVDFACYFVSEVAKGLDYMHRRSDEQGRNIGIVHRDISPQNVIVSYSGTVKIIDFGIAKAAIQIHITDSGVLKGKFAYMSPEQASGEQSDHRTDIFSLGVILFELLTGKRLFKGKDKRETLQNVRRANVPHPSSIRKDLPPEIDRIVLKALARDPKKRYMWASELHDDLVKFIYTNYADFKASSIEDYIRKLFQDELMEKESAEEEAKTPFLIIDHTQSAILSDKMDVTNITRVPPQLKEFMLDDETPIDETKEPSLGLEEKSEHLNIRSSLRVHWQELKNRYRSLIANFSKDNIKKLLGRWRGFRAHWRGMTIGSASLLMILFALFVTGVSNNAIEVPYWLQTLASKFTWTIGTESDGIKMLPRHVASEPTHFATLEITSEPAGATIFLNDIDTNLKTPAKLKSLEPNKEQNIGIFLDGYTYWSRNFNFKPDEQQTMAVPLEPSYSGIEIISTPDDADVVIDGVPSGKTPFKKENLKPGTVLNVAVSKDGFIGWSGKVQIKAGKLLVMRPNLYRTKASLVPTFLRDLGKPTPPTEPLPRNLEPSQRPTEMLPAAPLK